MKKIATLLFSLSIILTACSQEENKQEEKPPELLEVSINTADTITTNQETTIEAIVTQGNEKVTAADEVKFELSKAGEENHETIKAKHFKNGIYTIQKTFNESGNYVIVAHVTANSMHAMPKKEVSVEPGAPSKGEQTPHSEQPTGDSHDHHTSKVELEFHVDGPLTSQKPHQLKASFKQNNHPVTGALVRFEIWDDNSSPHIFHNSIEGPTGEYSLSHTFSTPGKYTVKIHIEKGELHDHTEEVVEVK